MAISFSKEKNTFNLSTKNTTYVFGIYPNGALVHLYYGGKLVGEQDADDFIRYLLRSCSSVSDRFSECDLPMEYPTFSSDVRTPALHIRYSDGTSATRLLYKSHEIYKGKKALSGLPSFYVEEGDGAETLEVTLLDEAQPLKVVLSYTVYESLDIITRSVRVINEGEDKIEVLKAMSLSIDFQSKDFDLVHLKGSWANERHIERVPVMTGGQYVDSKRGSSSHFHAPFVILADKNTDENVGEAFCFGLVYSGNFKGQTEQNSEKILRVQLGINDFDFKWTLYPNEEFQTPEAVSVWSGEGFNKMSQTLHTVIRKRLCRGKYRDSSRPVLLNNWEATYFDFDEEKIVNIARSAKELGVELMVLDDGWFGKRNDDLRSLGDWYPNLEKLPNGITGLAERVSELGMKFGLWFEPEMISPDSDLYRAHPDWAIQIKGRTAGLSRHQLVLDLSRPEVCDYVVESVGKVLSSAKISYVKWDLNRNMSEVGSLSADAERQSETYHRYMLGLYSVLERLTKDFPDVLFEGCSGGGGRFDLGMLPYFAQIWTSDDSDAIERTYIQYGTSLVFPASTMGAHVSAVPNHQVGRVTPLSTRGNIAMLGRLGYELDLGGLSESEKEEVKSQIKLYKEIESTVHNGTMYRLKSPFETNHFATEIISEDGKRVIVVYATVLGRPNSFFDRLYLKGLDEDATYILDGRSYSGSFLMRAGLLMSNDGDFSSKMMILEREN